jgi:acyl-CoA hydrolase
MFSDAVVELVRLGVVNGRRKCNHPGKVVASFATGTRRVFDFLDDNPAVAMLDFAYVNDPAVIRRNPKVAAINSAVEIDLTGQVCADSVGTRQISGCGGQVDFLRGAALSVGGLPIVALPSRTAQGASRIVPLLQPGAAVVTTRAHVRFVVTEHGVADLQGRNLRQRAAALIGIAHPEHRESLARASHARFGSSALPK